MISQGDWLTRAEVFHDASPERFLNHTVGWLLHEDEDAVIIASQVATDDTEPRFDLVMRIPKVLIKKRKVLKP